MVSPAGRLRDVVVSNEQTGAVWRARRAEIIEGLIHVHGPAPDDFDPLPFHTFIIVAFDAAGRARRFAGVVVDRERSRIPQLVVFA